MRYAASVGIIALALVAANTADARSVQSAPALSRIASQMLGQRVTVIEKRFSDDTAGLAERPGTIWLDSSVVRQLRSAAVSIDVADAVFIFTHEIGHLSGTHSDVREEDRADCYAVKNWRTVSLKLGYRKSDLPSLDAGSRCYS